MRVIMIYTPGIILLHLAIYGSAVAAITAIPVYLMGFMWYSAAVVAAVVVAAIVYGIKWYKRRQFERLLLGAEDSPVSSGTSVASSKQVNSKLGFGRLIWQWVVALKQHICQTINFAHTEEQS